MSEYEWILTNSRKVRDWYSGSNWGWGQLCILCTEYCTYKIPFFFEKRARRFFQRIQDTWKTERRVARCWRHVNFFPPSRLFVDSFHFLPEKRKGTKTGFKVDIHQGTKSRCGAKWSQTSLPSSRSKHFDRLKKAGNSGHVLGHKDKKKSLP